MNETYSIGVDLGGTNLRIASYAGGVDFLDSILLRTRLEEGHDRVVRDLCEAVSSLMDRDYGARRLVGIGVGTPGPLELPEGTLRNPPNLPGWDNFNLREAIESTLGRRVAIESDANVAAIAEQMCGAGMRHGIDSLCALTLGTGVGSGLVLEGRIWHGATGMGGEAGHIIVHEHDGAPCGCGGSGCLEIGITGFEANPTDAENEPSQVFIEVYEGQSAGPCLGWTFPGPGHNADRSFTGEVTAANIAPTTAERNCSMTVFRESCCH